MNIALGIRVALAGGRESLARVALMAAGVGAGVLLLLLTLSAMPVLQTHVDRLAWHRTTERSAPTAADPAMWLAVTDHYAGRDIIRVHVAALGSRPPVPPGIDRLPGPGEVFASPALAGLLAEAPEDQLRQRFPGRVTGTIGPDGLIGPAELVGIVGHTPAQMSNMHGAQQIRGIEQPRLRVNFGDPWQTATWVIGILIAGPIVVLVMMATRIGGARREQRFAAIRLAGATRLQTAVLAAAETALAAIVGSFMGLMGYLAIRPLAASQITLGHGTPIFAEDIAAPLGQALLVLVAAPVVAVATTLVALRPVQLGPLGVRRGAPRRPPQAWRLLPLAAGVLAAWAAAAGDNDPATGRGPLVASATVLAPSLILVGLALTGPWVCMWASRGMARISAGPASLIVARRIAADPYSTFRSVSGAALAMFLATAVGLAAQVERDGGAEREMVLDDGIIAVHVSGAPAESLAPLMSERVVVARLGADNRVVVACGELARVSKVTCPLPVQYADKPVDQLFTLPEIFSPRGYAEPGPGSAGLPVQTLFVPTDGSLATQERIRTFAAVTVPSARTVTNGAIATRHLAAIDGYDALLPPLMVFVLIVAACSLTVSVVSGLMERRRPLALLRAAGVRIGELRRIVLLETGVPLALTVLGGVGAAILVAYTSVPRDEWMLPSAGFFAGLGIGAVAAFALTLIALPIMDVATRHDSVRFE